MIADFSRLLGTLAGGSVEFVIVGGIAARLHGSGRVQVIREERERQP